MCKVMEGRGRFTLRHSTGAEVEASTADGATPLNVAANHGHVAVVKTLVEMGADKEALTCTVDGTRPLHTAAWRGHVEVLTALVEFGVDIGALNGSGETPLQVSIRTGHHHVARVLRELERSARAPKKRLRPRRQRLRPRSPRRRP
jgi:ankyrin repeat protein